MTKKILINDSWMYSLGDLQRFFTESHINDASSRLELLSLFHNGVLVDWLSSTGEISKAKQIESIDKKQREASLCCDISNIIGLNIKTVYRKHWKEVFSVRRAKCRKKTSTFTIDIPIFVIRNINENFSITYELVFKSGEKIIDTITINTIDNDYKQGCVKNLTIKQKCPINFDVKTFSLSVEGETVYNTYAKTYVSSKDYNFDALTPSEYNYLTRNSKQIGFPNRNIELQSHDKRVKFWQKIDWDISLTEFEITWSDIAAFTMFVILGLLNNIWLNVHTEYITSTLIGACLQLTLLIMPYTIGFASINIYEKETLFNDDFFPGLLCCFFFLIAVTCIFIIPACIWDSWNFNFLNSEPLEWRIIFFILSVAPTIAPIVGKRIEGGYFYVGVISGMFAVMALIYVLIVVLWNSMEHLYYYLFS